MLHQFRYNYSASYSDGKGGIGGGTWMSLDEVRRAVKGALRDDRFDPASIAVIIQEKKSRWVPLNNGSVSEVFPELWAEWLVERKTADYLAMSCLNIGDQQTDARIVYRNEVEFELKTYGLANALVRAEKRCAQTQAFRAVLQGIESIHRTLREP